MDVYLSLLISAFFFFFSFSLKWCRWSRLRKKKRGGSIYTQQMILMSWAGRKKQRWVALCSAWEFRWLGSLEQKKKKKILGCTTGAIRTGDLSRRRRNVSLVNLNPPRSLWPTEPQKWHPTFLNVLFQWKLKYLVIVWSAFNCQLIRPDMTVIHEHRDPLFRSAFHSFLFSCFLTELLSVATSLYFKMNEDLKLLSSPFRFLVSFWGQFFISHRSHPDITVLDLFSIDDWTWTKTIFSFNAHNKAVLLNYKTDTLTLLHIEKEPGTHIDV